MRMAKNIKFSQTDYDINHNISIQGIVDIILYFSMFFTLSTSS